MVLHCKFKCPAVPRQPKSSGAATARLDKNCQRLGLVSVSAI